MISKLNAATVAVAPDSNSILMTLFTQDAASAQTYELTPDQAEALADTLLRFVVLAMPRGDA